MYAMYGTDGMKLASMGMIVLIKNAIGNGMTGKP